MKKLATLSMCALSFLAASAVATAPIPVSLEVPGYRTPEQTSMTVEDGVYNINFAGEFGTAQEYEVFTSETTQPMLDGVTYCLEFDYQCAEALDDVNWLYWPKNGVTQSWCHDWLKGHLAPTAEGEWGHAKLTFTDRFKYGFGRGTGHVVRLHLRPSTHVSGDKKGQPFSVKIKDISFVPVQAEAPETTDVLPVEIGDVTKSDLDYVSKEVNAEGEYTLTWQGNFAALGNSGHYIEYNAFTAEMPHGMMPGIDYKLVFEYKGPALDDFSGLYHADGLYGDNVGTQSKVSIPASENDWTTVELPLADRGSHNWWGWSATSSLRLNFNDGSYTSQEGANFGQPMTVKVRGFKYVPEKIVTAIENVAVDGAEAADAEPEYYNIQGQRVMNPGKGLYIVRQGSKVTKVIL